MTPDILAILYTYDRYEVLKLSLESMFRKPGLPFRLWVIENGSAFSNMYGKGSGEKQLQLLLDYYRDGKIELMVLNNKNVGCNHAINQLMALAKLTSTDPKITRPEFVFQSNDDMVFEDDWLLETHTALLDAEGFKEGVWIASPFHCKNRLGQLAHGMETIDHYQVGNKNYELKWNVSGNTWYMRGGTWLDVFDWYPVNHPTEGGDWQKLAISNKAKKRCVVTINEMAHHNPDAEGGGKYNRLGHW